MATAATAGTAPDNRVRFVAEADNEYNENYSKDSLPLGDLDGELEVIGGVQPRHTIVLHEQARKAETASGESRLSPFWGEFLDKDLEVKFVQDRLDCSQRVRACQFLLFGVLWGIVVGRNHKPTDRLDRNLWWLTKVGMGAVWWAVALAFYLKKFTCRNVRPASDAVYFLMVLCLYYVGCEETDGFFERAGIQYIPAERGLRQQVADGLFGTCVVFSCLINITANIIFCTIMVGLVGGRRTVAYCVLSVASLAATIVYGAGRVHSVHGPTLRIDGGQVLNAMPPLIALFALANQALSSQRQQRLVRLDNVELRKQIEELEAPPEATDLSSLDAAVVSGQVRKMVTNSIAGSAEAWHGVQSFIKAAGVAVPLVARARDSELGASAQRVATARIALEVTTAWMDRVAGIAQAHRKGVVGKVFLGGSCNPTTWRRDTAIPLLTRAGVPFYNPQVDDWTPELVQIEAEAKEKAEVLLFVIDGQTRALASIVEASEYICRGRHVVLSIVDIAPGTAFGGEEPVGAAELKDLNRQRSYLRDVATRHGITFSSSVQGACDEIVQYYDELWQSGRDGGSAVPPAVQVQPEAEAGAAAQAVC
eukprot:g7656.t1